MSESIASTMADPSTHPSPERRLSIPVPITTIASQDTPPALATTKRKFHQILENITRPTKRPLSSSSITSIPDTPAKRIRLEARSRLDGTSKPSTIKSTLPPAVRERIDAQLLKARLEAAKTAPFRAGSTPDTRVREPNYNPWSHVGFLRRLKTFSNVRVWSSKPDAINEVEWAKRGWVCDKNSLNTVACRGGCEARVVVGLRPALKDEEGKEIDGTEDMSVELSEELVRRVGELIVEGHKDECLWKGGGCRDDIYRLPLVKQAVWEMDLRERYESFVKANGQFPEQESLLSAVDVQHLVGCLPSGFSRGQASVNAGGMSNQTANVDDTLADPPTNLNSTALIFSLHGWTIPPESTSDCPLATCDACFRRLGLWLYMSSSPSAIPAEASRLDLTTQHRPHCPWINASSQCMPRNGSLAGLDGTHVLARCIENAARFRDGARLSNTSLVSASDSTDGTATKLNAESGLDGTLERAVEDPKVARQRVKDVQAAEDRARFAKLRALTKTLRLKGLGMRLRMKQFN